MLSRLMLVAGCVAVVAAARNAAAQAITVQQPVFSNFTVGTTVSVPDRGSALLGSVSRAGDLSRTFGPLGLGGRTRSSFRDHAGVTAHVWIHDFEEMDRLLLNQAGANSRASSEPALNGYAARSYRSLLTRDRTRRAPSVARSARKGRAAGTQRVPGRLIDPGVNAPGSPRTRLVRQSSSARAEKFYRLGLRAEERGAVNVARLHYRMAAGHGSKRATHKLARLDEESSDAVPGPQ